MTPIPADEGLLAEVRERLAGWTEESVRSALGDPLRIAPVVDVDLYRRRLADDRSERATLAKLFVLGTPVPAEDAEAVLVDAGLAELDGALVRPLVRLVRYEWLLVASDVFRSPQPPDFVTGVSPAARRVARLTIRRPVESALDLGTGSGIQALLAARHTRRVVATDVSEHALGLTRLNARLNGIANVETRAGDWFEPVARERFDLIVANPPYVVSPDTQLLYRDSSLPADAVTRKLLSEVPDHLEEGGFAHVMGNWVHGRDEDWRAVPEECVAGRGCDALLLRYWRADPVSYAARWNLLEPEPELVGAVDRWLDYYRREGIEAISEGMIVLRRRSGPRNWIRAIEVPGGPTAHAGEHVLRLFEARDRRRELADDDAVLSSRFAPMPGLRLSRRSQAESGKLAPRESRVGLENGIGFAARIGSELADVLTRCDGSRVLGELVGEAAADPVEAAATMRRLFALGLVSLDPGLQEGEESRLGRQPERSES